MPISTGEASANKDFNINDLRRHNPIARSTMAGDHQMSPIFSADLP
ncbi:MAG TPA: hypothetical protein VJS30_10455 [Paraburkholderia sp.]|nr:hypothetical protein [Paraburkholderia sp.]